MAAPAALAASAGARARQSAERGLGNPEIDLTTRSATVIDRRNNYTMAGTLRRKDRGQAIDPGALACNGDGKGAVGPQPYRGARRATPTLAVTCFMPNGAFRAKFATSHEEQADGSDRVTGSGAILGGTGVFKGARGDVTMVAHRAADSFVFKARMRGAFEG